MYFTKLIVLQLLWLALASASHFYGSTTSHIVRKDIHGRFHVEIRNKATYRGCQFHYGTCRTGGTCGHNTEIQAGVIDSSPNSATYGSWCETETVVTKILTTDKPFQLREYSCCWIHLTTTAWDPYWSVLTKLDLGTRSDTKAPNDSPDVAILPFLRVPQNCKRSYRPIFIDPEGDTVRCRYGNYNDEECYDCRRQIGFQVDEKTCTLHYLAYGNQGVHGFELVVEDYPRNNVVVSYSDGSRSLRYGTHVRKKRWVWPMTTTPSPTTTFNWWLWYNSMTTSTTTFPTTTSATPTTTTIPPTTTSYPTTTTPYPTTTTPYTTTTTPYPTTTTPYPTTTTPYTTTTTPSWYWPTTTTPYPSTPGPRPTGVWTTPFSVLPLQFVFTVDPVVPSCEEGLYLPKFVYPTPRYGQVFQAEAGREVEIKVKAQATYSVVDNIIMTGPLNITKHRTTGDLFTIKWTPIHENIGQYFPICFVVEFKYGASIYQTEMRCVVVNVTAEKVNTVVTCKESSMIVEVEKATLPRIHYDHLSLSDPSNSICSLQTHSNSTHVVAIVPLNRCGTEIEEDEEDLIFKNEITTVDTKSSLITRRHQVEIQFFCQYAKKGNVSNTFTAHRDKVTVWDKGLGQFTYGFEFFPNQDFLAMIDPRLYPLDYDVGERIYMEIDATTTVDNTQLFVESCRASPYDIPNYHTTYTIIENGCSKDSTLIVHPVAHKRQFRFSVEAFKFIGLHDQVYISCTVLMCEAGNSNTRCSKGCLPNGSRGKREAVTESGTHYVSQGPLRLKRSVEAAGATGLNLNLNLVFITGCVLAVVGMICGVIFYKTKRSAVKYRPLPSEEN